MERWPCFVPPKFQQDAGLWSSIIMNTGDFKVDVDCVLGHGKGHTTFLIFV